MICLKALDLFGFKSFADRTRFEFPQGVTAVVGPNGSGKSNVVDAIKWVLGEQSARSLRGKEMTDVIFAGTASRKPLNMAEVTLVFNNSSRELPLPTEDVQITRRVYRNGESEYLVNGETARLKDIRELFSGTGAATEAYSVIEQGRVDALLVASGKDRRIVFEEAAGITRFRARRADALRRLDRAEQNRQRLADIVGEVAGRLETVRNQAARARRFQNLSDRLRHLRIIAATRDLDGVDAQVAAIESALAKDRTQLLEMEAIASTASAELAAIVDAGTSHQPRVAGLRVEASAAHQREAAAFATLQSCQQRRDEIEDELRRAIEVTAAASRETRAASAGLASAESALQAAIARGAVIDGKLAECRHAAAGSVDDANTARLAMARATTARDELREQRLRLDAAKEAFVVRLVEANSAVADARDEIDRERDHLAAILEGRAASEGHIRSLEARMAAATRETNAAEEAHSLATRQLQAAWKALANVRATAEACRERRDILQEIVDRQDGISDAARRLLLTEARSVPGLAGMVADQIAASVEWAAVVDLALGRRGSALVVSSLTDAIQWHAGWTARNREAGTPATPGRIGFLAHDSLPDPDEHYDISEHRGVVGRLDRIMTETASGFMPGNAALARRLLGHVWVVDDIGIAASLVNDAPTATVFMTRGGERLSSADGFETGGNDTTAGLVARRSELRDVSRRFGEWATRVAEALAEVSNRETDVAMATDAVSAARGRRHEASDALAKARSELERTGRDEVAADAAIATAEQRLRAAERRAVSAEAALREATAVLEDVSQSLVDAENQTVACQAAIDALERNRGDVIEEVHRLQLEKVTACERLERLRESVQVAQDAIVQCRDRVKAALAAQAAATVRTRTFELEWLAAGARLSIAAWDAEQADAALQEAETEQSSMERGRQRCERTRDDARDTSIRLAEQIHTRELEAGNARHLRARVAERIRDEYDLDIDALMTNPPTAPAADDGPPVPGDRAELEASIDQLRRKIVNMGHVNLEALAEVEELAARLAALEGQLTDVTQARVAIEELIARIDGESRRLLGETLETVRGHFRELFERVFGGGQADLVLEPGVDLLETSVEIVARPPGKEPRNISLLSGGEKTMTCVALLLAIFRSSPSPFCVLDEVDAALDEANVDRFVGVLRDFLSATQFIVVTHSKKTMAAAGTLYGVTMEEPGVSKRIAVRFESEAAGKVAVTQSKAA